MTSHTAIRLFPASIVLTAFLAWSQAPMVLTRSFWSDQEPESPRLPAQGSSLDFALRAANSANGPTLALLAAARLPGPVADAYGARAEGATQIVAVDSATGAVFTRPAEREGSAPLSPVLRSRRKPSGSGGATIDSIEVWFNADLRSHLGLPPEAKTYSVFLWLDDMTSPVHQAQLPASGQSAAAAATAAVAPTLGAAGIHFRKSRLSPHPPGHGIALRSGLAGRRTSCLHAALDIRGLSSPTVMLTVLSLDAITRQLAWRSFQLKLQDLQGSGGAFDFDASAVASLPKTGSGKLFVVAAIPQALSKVVTIQQASGN